MKNSISYTNKNIIQTKKSPLLQIINNFFFLVFATSINTISAQEVFDNNATGSYTINTQVANLYDLNVSDASGWRNDFKHGNDQTYKLQGNADAATADRFGSPSQALYFNGYKNLILPQNVTRDIVNNNNGFSISAWIKVPNNGNDCDILHFTNPSNGGREDIQVRMKNGYFQILKYSPVAQKKVVLGQARYKISYYNDNTNKEIYPAAGEYGEGYIYFMLSANKNSTRIYWSRPGGRLYANYFWFGLSDILTNSHIMTFGALNGQRGDIISALDDIMVYKEMLTPELANNHFLVQSPMYPSRSYAVRNYNNQTVLPDFSNAEGAYKNGYIKTKNPTNPTEGTYASERWQMPVRQKANGKSLIGIINSKAHLPLARWNANTGNYFYQETADFSAERQLFQPIHLIGNPNNLIDYRQNAFRFQVNEYASSGKQLGIYNNSLYLQNANTSDTNWHIEGSFNTSVRERFSRVSEKAIHVFNYGTKKSLTIFSGYAYEDANKYAPLAFVKKEPVFNTLDYQYGYEDFGIYIYGGGPDNIKPDHGLNSTTQQDYIKLSGNPGEKAGSWQLVYVKDDPNGKPLYLIRTNNGYGARILIPNYTTGGKTYITQNAIAEEGPSYPNNYLWSINVRYTDSGGARIANPSKDESKDIIVDSQNLEVYPNPVRGNATIEYTLLHSETINLYIVSSTGALVKTIKNGTQDKGTHKEAFNTSGWVSGVYLCVLQIDGQNAITKKIIVQ